MAKGNGDAMFIDNKVLVLKLSEVLFLRRAATFQLGAVVVKGVMRPIIGVEVVGMRYG